MNPPYSDQISDNRYADQIIDNREGVQWCANKLRARLDELSKSLDTYDRLLATNKEAAGIAYATIAEAVNYQSNSVKIAASMLELEINGEQ